MTPLPPDTERALYRVEVAPGGTLAVEVVGPAGAPVAPVLFGHSLLCDSQMFTHQVADLAARGHTVVTIDARAHGRSTVPDDQWTLEDQARDYVRVMQCLSIDRAAIVGLSMGAMAALRCALHTPERVAGMVLLDTSHRPEPRRNRLKYKLMTAILERIGPDRRLVETAVNLLFGETFRASSPDVVRRYVGRIQALDPVGVAMAARAVTLRGDLADAVTSIRTPSVVVCGAEDRATPPHLAVELASALATDYVEIPRAGHLSTLEAPIHTRRVIADFLESIGWTPEHQRTS